MKNFYHPGVSRELYDRVAALQPTAQRQWGTMNAAQMMHHCSTTLEMVADRRKIPRTWLGRILGPLFRSDYLGEKPLRRNSPTHPQFVVVEEKEFLAEQGRLLALINEVEARGEAGCTRQPHSFFGPFSPEEWGISTYKHLDHHLRQFGG